jgi:hypothetical protein
MMVKTRSRYGRNMTVPAQLVPYDTDITQAAALAEARGFKGPHRRSVRITAAGAEGLGDTFGFDVAR